MNHMKTALTALAVAAFSAGAASAVTTVTDSQSSGGALAPDYTNFGDEITVQFEWNGSPASSYIEFTTTNSFNVFFTNYSPRDGQEVSGYVLTQVGGATLTNNTSFCNGSDTLAGIRGNCNLITGVDANPSQSDVIRPDSDNPIFASLDAGTYRLGIKEGGDPSSAVAGFDIAEVPLPAGGLLLIGAMGGIATLRRRKKA